jgi:Tol biopolymer transport system component
MALRIRSDRMCSRSMKAWVPLSGCLAFMFPAHAQTAPGEGATRLVSATTAGLPVGSLRTATPGPNTVSADGRFVVFASDSADIVPGDTNGRPDVFLRDMQNGTVQRVDVGPGGVEADFGAEWPSISADGRFVAYHSAATNLVPGDRPEYLDVFVYDRIDGTTRRIAVDAAGTPPDDTTGFPSISGDGRYVAFMSMATNFAAGRGAGRYALFLQELATGRTEHVDVAQGGGPAGGEPWGISINADGRYVAFGSDATNLVPGDTNASTDVFVRDRLLQTTERVSVGASGVQSDSLSHSPSISADGRHVAFQSSATNLAPGGAWPYNGMFVRDRQSNTTARVSVYQVGVQDPGNVSEASISADGRYVAFSYYTGGEPAAWHVVRRDRLMSHTAWIDVASSGVVGNDVSASPVITPDGRYVVFQSLASNFAPGDSPGTLDLFRRDNAPTGPGTQSYEVTPQSASYADQTLGTSSAPQGFTVRNTGTAPLLIQALRIKGANARKFLLTHLCGASLPPGTDCDLQISFRPTWAGPHQASLEVIAGDEPATTRWPLTGSGVRGQGKASPSLVEFAAQPLRTTSKAKAVRVTNTGRGVLPIKGIYLTGPDARQFVRAQDCLPSLEVGAACTVRVYFKPTSRGSKTATLTIWAGGGAGPMVVAVSGTGT